MARDLRGWVAVITGASSGIGRETALEFARAGTHVVLGARREARLQEVAQEASRLGVEAVALVTDVADRRQVERLVGTAYERFGRVDILVNNAGYGMLATVEQTTEEELSNIFAVNFMSNFYAIKAVLPIMLKQGRGHIFNVSSIAGRRGMPLYGAYCATKFAQCGLTEALRVELKGTGIDVSLVCPVGTATEFFDAMTNKAGRKAQPAGLAQSPQAVARAIVRCARRPRPEVLPFPLARTLLVLNSISPRLGDLIMGAYYKRRQAEP